MFKSKLFQYCAIAATAAITSGVIVSTTASLQSQSVKYQDQTKVETQKQLQHPNNFAELPESTNKFAANSPNMPSGKVLKQLNLTLEQLQKLKAVRDRDQKQIRELGQKLRQTNKELQDLLAGNEGSDVIRAKHKQVIELQRELQNKHFERMLAMREVLTPQQRRQLKDIMEKNRDQLREDMKGRMQNRLENRRERLDKLRDRLTL
ncbi:MAG: Spy/CpxP family protein refolding chaperone [Pseudanabaena sp.]|jgi:protein CpxP|nr:Spy/CpxP family protein refolding chaperone [Pseudanabaena sp. M135S2SP2A07QC]MCA6573961.1 Spy/CpxP family protein refolding chaperone [Pseudanabaena sp. M53BS1SP1A06MG]MCA6584766.1 Spy/CpxP family protein refolding chaperone [Pseudanabaena sp. M34BS1SP1A06MG]MCA6585928.1 Spy/CpxP family protein refolding chaperone [Pseudanabaena sp. M051S1SP1A06QC]MCA6588201.1 Spy/CpxP family protein refolding chaperone [Pseudanabaena sp. M109S1SP1A06QC]MCA6594244.1 Spy/CpxP family protein refolding chaper